MAEFKKAEMLYENDYSWKRDKGDGPETDYRDRNKLDRDEGYEVLDFANSYFNKNVLFATKTDLHKLEKLLRNSLPPSVVLKSEIIDFLKKNW